MKRMSKKVLGIFMALFMFATSFIQPFGLSFGLIDAYSAEHGPSMDLSITHLSGGNVSDPLPGQQPARQVMIGHGEANAAKINMIGDFRSGVGEGRNAYFDLKLPYFYKDSQGQLSTTYEFADIPADQRADPMCLAVKVAGDTEDWEVDKTTEYKGRVHFQSAKTVKQGNQIALTLSIYFKGAVPENTSALIYLGGGYETYAYQGVTSDGWSATPEMATNNGIYEFICSNLKWTPGIEAVTPRNALWDKFNYLVYKITVSNDSEDPASHIKAFSANVEVPTEGNDGYGLHMKEAMHFLYNNGNPIENNSFELEDRENLFVGVPAQGGALIYDVTGIPQEVRDEWNLITFLNAKDQNGNPLEPIPYTYTSSSSVYFSVYENIYAQEYVDNDETGESVSFKEFYIALPMSTDIPEAQKSMVNCHVYDTIVFGSDYTWTKQSGLATHGFDDTKTGFVHRKYVVDEGVVKSEKTASIGDEVEYYLGKFKNTSNVPVFEANTVDTVPKDFNLKRITAYMQYDDEDEEYVPELSDWFKEDDTVEFEFKTGEADSDGNDVTVFVPLGSMTYNSEKSSEDAKAYTLEVGTIIEDYIKAQAALGKTVEYTNKFRINFKHRIAPKEELNGKIEVQGTVDKGIKYENNLVTNYETWQWINKSAVVEEADYYKKNNSTSVSTATIVATPADPKILTDVTRVVGDELTAADSMYIPINVPGTGFRYKLGNSSRSKVIPGILKSGQFLDLNQNKPLGFITNKIVLSKELMDVAEVDSVTVYCFNGKNQTPKTVKIPFSSFSVDDDGNYYLDSSAWKSVGECYEAYINFKSFGANIALSDKIYVQFQGYTNVVKPAADPLVVKGTFTTDYNDPNLDKAVTDPATMIVNTINPIITGFSFDDTESVESKVNTAKGEAKQTVINHIEIPNKQKNVGYEWSICNAAISPSGAVDIAVDLSSSVGNKTPNSDDPTVKGYLTQKITISDFADVAAIESVKIYGWNKNPKTDEPDLTIPFSSLTVVDGKVVIDADMLKSIGYVKNIVISCSEFYGSEKEEPDKMNIRLDGYADWYGDLDAVLTFTPENESMANRIITLTNRLRVLKPYAEIHAFIDYYDLAGSVLSSSSNSDKNENTLGVPYDRNFSYTVKVGNPYVSKLDDFEITLNLPLTAEGSDFTGFHTTGFSMSKNLIDNYETLEYFTFYDASDPENGHKFTFNKEDGTLTSDDGKIFSVVDENGNIAIDEKMIFADWGIESLNKVVVTGKNFAANVNCEDDNYLEFTGFSDSYFNSSNRLGVTAVDYFDGIRTEADTKTVSTDGATAYISKMYFDSTIVAAYKDSKIGSRFDAVSTSREHVRMDYFNCSNSRWNDNSELDIGYKAIGSYLVDFRQYLNANTNGSNPDKNIQSQPSYPNTTKAGLVWQEHQGMNYVYTQSFNTAANVDLNITLPANSFDASYLKVHPLAKDYLESIKVTRQDGTEIIIDKSEWQNNSVEMAVDKDGNKLDKFFRIDLLQSADSEALGIYKTPVSYVAENPVTSVVISLNINKNEAESDKASNPDYGTWFDYFNDNSRFMFEVTGRFYKTGTASATVKTDMEIGNIVERPYSQAKDRSTQGVLNQKTDWSFTNKYRRHYYTWYCRENDNLYDAADLFSTTNVYVYNEQNQILKGVHKTPATTQDLNCTFGTYNEFSVSFFQNTFGSAHDYASGAGSGWYEQDAHDWADKHSFTDRLVLEDKLPIIKPDAETEYYGYLTQKIYISPKLYPFIDHIEFTKKTVTVDDNGNATETIDSNKIVIDKDDLKLYVNDGTTVENPSIVGTDQGVTHEGFYEINVYYPEDKDAAESDNTIILGENEFLDGYSVYLKDLPGNGDYTRELEGYDLLSPTDHDSNATPDIFVGGEVYRVRENNPPAVDYNKMTASSSHYQYNNATSKWDTTQYYTMNDTGLLMGYRIPFQAAWQLTATNASHYVYDYQTAEGAGQNVNPNYANYALKIWNRADTDQQTGRSSYIDSATITQSMEGSYRLKHIYIPEEFIDGNWFNVESFQIKYGNNSAHSVTYNLKQLKESGYFTKDGNQYVFDLNPFIKDNLDKFYKYNSNNYETGDSYVSEWIHSFVIKLSAVDKKKENGEGVLKGGEYLNPVRQSFVGDSAVALADAVPTMTYDGVFVERTVEDVNNNAWTKKSRPTIWHGPNGNHEYTSDTSYYNTSSVSFTSSEKNAEAFKNISPTDSYRDYYRVYNLVANMNVKAERITAMDDGTKTFAYDIDEAGGDNTYLNVDRNHLLPDDYIEYQLTVKASDTSMIPVYHPDIRFVAPTGQRIVGWYIIKNDSDIADDDITAKISTSSTGSNTAITSAQIDKKKFYSLVEGTDGNEETYYRRLDISAGDLTKSEAENQLQKGKSIVVSVITQLTDELGTFEGKTINPGIYAAAHPQHTYSQYRIRNINNDAPYYTYQHYYTDSAEDAEYHRYNTTSYYGELNNELTYMSDIRTSTTYYDSRNLKLDVNYTDPEFHYDGMPMKFTMSGGTGANNATAANAENDTLHSLERATYTVSFLQTANGKLYKGFDLTEKPEFPYPAVMDADGTKKAKVEYCFFDNIGTDVGIYETNAPETEVWLTEDQIVDADSLTAEQIADGYRLLKDAVKIKWTYYDVPAGTAANPVVFATPANPFVLIGVGRYRDIRTDAQKKTTAADDYFTLKISGSVELKHRHNESVENTLVGSTDVEEMQFNEPVSLYGTGVITKVIVRERPIVSLHTQIFKNESEAETAYNSSASQVKGYRPGDTVWYKDTVQNLQKASDAPQGVLLNPVFFDKIPEYIAASGLESAVQTGNTDNIKVVWYNRDGSVKTEIPEFTVTKTQFDDVPDYLGDSVAAKSDTDGTSFSTHRAFADFNLAENGNTVSTPITFNLYKIKFKDGTRLEIGERIEVYYSATVRMENLPLSYTQRGTADNAKTFVDYYPKYGEYYSVPAGADTNYGTIYQWFTRSYPYIGVMPGQNLYSNATASANYCGSFTQFMNANSMMDMNYLYHDLGVSGLRNKNIDKYEYLKDSNIYIPGYDGDETEDGWIDSTSRYRYINYGGSNGYLKDYDINIDKNQQITTYVPALTQNKLDQLPVSEKYVKPSSNRDRDWFNKMLVYRNRSENWQEEHEDAVIWAESRIHLQTAWLASSSEIIGTEDNLESKEYLPTNYNGYKLDPKYNYSHPTWASGSYSVWGYYTGLNEAVRLYNDDNVPTIEFDQYFTSRISAYNYGDWDLTSGLEFIYVMPKGIEPELNDDGSVNIDEIAAKIMSGGTSNNPLYTDIDSDSINVQVLQKPGSAAGYQTPNIIQDPNLSSQTLNKTGHSYVDENQYYSSDAEISWVLKITVDHSLGKWFNRGSDSGYMMYVDIPSHVYETPESEYWYDEVMVRPLDTEDQNSLYYQIYDTTSLWGHNDLTKLAVGSQLSTQYGGMDYLWNSFYHYYGGGSSGATQGPNGNCYYVSASPNMPYINGMNISNREVSAQGMIDDSGKENFESGKRNTYASTGTRAHMRKPLIRTWTTIGEENILGTNPHGYYLDSQGDTSTLNIHVENKYWLNTMAADQHWYGWVSTGKNSGYYSESQDYRRIRHTYSTDGGNKGTLYYPVVTNILPVGVVPKDVNGRLFTEDNEENAKKQLDWSLYNYSYSGNTSTDYEKFDAEKALYEAKVEYILLDCEDGSTEGRYKITFKQKSDDLTTANSNKIKISSEDARVFQFKIYTLNAPDGITRDGELNNDLLDVFQRNHTFVSSQLENFRFLIDSEVQDFTDDNPYYVGSRYVKSYRNWYAPPSRPNDNTPDDVRKDSAVGLNRLGGKAGNLPDCPVLTENLGTNAAVDGTDEGGNKRYFEEDGKITLRDNFDKSKITDLQMEDYTKLRYGLTIQPEYVDFDAGNDSTNIGVHTTNRIRVRWPDIESNAYLTDKPSTDIDNLGVRSPEGTEGKYVYYPDAADKSKAVQYGDNFYYNVKVSNGATEEDHFHHGNVLHAKIKVVVALPNIARFNGKFDENGKYIENSMDEDALYLIHQLEDGTVNRYTFGELEDAGYEIEFNEEIDENGRQNLILEILTPGAFEEDETPNYIDYVAGKHLPGWFSYYDKMVVGFKTTIHNNMEDDSDILNGEAFWDNDYKADGYAALEDIDGEYLKQKYPTGGFEKLSDRDESKIAYEREAAENEETGIDIDYDEVLNERFSHDVSAAVTLLKPHANVRLDTSVQRLSIINPDLTGGTVRVVEDPSVKGATKMTLYIDQAKNDGAKVPEFILDYRIPFRGTYESTRNEADASEDPIKGNVYAVGTGVWEIPESAGDEDYREALKEHLSVKIYGLYSDSDDPSEYGKLPYEDNSTYENVNDYGKGKWVNLTAAYNNLHGNAGEAGVPIDENTVLDITELSNAIVGNATLVNRIYQIRFVISSDDASYLVPQNFRLAIDADPDTDGVQNMDDIDPEHENLNPLPESIISNIKFRESGMIDVDNSSVGDAAFVIAAMSHQNATRRHVNHFVNAWARYDDEQYGAIANRSRAGYFITREIPVLEVDLKSKYFKRERNDETKKYEYHWSDDVMISDSSKMLKYIASVKNLSDSGIAETNLGDVEEDAATDVQISTVLPFIQNIDKTVSDDNPNEYKFYKQVSYNSEEWQNTISNDNVSSSQLYAEDSKWCWHVENEDGEWVSIPEITSVTLNINDKITDLTNTLQRRVLTFTSTGILRPGQRLVVEFMVPVTTDNGVGSSNLLSCKAYGFKPGAFVPYIPSTDNGTETYAFEIDKRDVNNNGMMNSENTITKNLGGISFSSTRVFNRTKVSFSEYGTGLNVSGNDSLRPSVVPEGTKYSFVSSLINPDTSPDDGGNRGYDQPIIYDVLPYKNDTSLIKIDDQGNVAQRGTNWRGYIKLDTIVVNSVTTGVGSEELKDGVNANIWIGPFNYDAKGNIVDIPMANLPDVDQTSDKEFFKSIRGEGLKAVNEKKKYFVRLRDILALKNKDLEKYEKIESLAQAVYVEPLESYYLGGSTKLSLSYDMKPPLNIPLYNGVVDEADPDLKIKVKDFDSWNSFAAQTGDEVVTESSYAGVYLAAPSDKGYIGHYVWLDENYNADFTDEGDYVLQGGRLILKNPSKDLNYDGKIDDPGINGVKVELLSENGYPVNRFGEAVVEKDGRYYLIDESTGEFAYDTTNKPTFTTAGPVSYTTEKDVYGHDGYFIISNITPGNYKLRYTFPENGKYDEYALTTRFIGVTDTPVEVYRKGDTLPDLGSKGTGDEPSDCAKATSFIVQTKSAIKIDAIGKNPSKYDDYDEKMTSYDLGVAPSFKYGGFAFMDNGERLDGKGGTDGYMNDNEERISDVQVQFYEVKTDKNGEETWGPAYNADGEEVKTLVTDANGHYETTLYPYRSYIAVADTSKVLRLIEPSPVTRSTYPLKIATDNDLSFNKTAKKNTTSVMSVVPQRSEYPMGECVNGQYGIYDRLDLGFVDVGIGSIGKYVFNDENYDGIRNESLDDDGLIITEPGVNGVTLVLEQYYLDDNNKWVYIDDIDSQESYGSAYTFIIKDTTYIVDGERYLCGYKVKMDMSTVPEGFVPTKYKINNGISDSDLPLIGKEDSDYRYLNENPIIIAALADEDTVDEYKMTAFGDVYDITHSQTVLDVDAGLTIDEKSEISGLVWDDKNYDGIQNSYTDENEVEIDEEGIADIELQLEPYVFTNNKWKLLKSEDLMDDSVYNDYIKTVTTDADGNYKFEKVESTAVIKNENGSEHCIVGYKIKVNTEIEKMNYGVTKYFVNDGTEDSHLIRYNDGGKYLNPADEYIITAKEIAASDVNKEYGTDYNKNNLIIHNSLGYFDINKVVNYDSFDAGLIQFETNSIAGRVWLDKDYDGLMDENEPGIENISVTIKRYYLEKGGSGADDKASWIEDADFNNNSPVAVSDADGNYTFDNLATHIYKDGKYYLAGYKPFVVAHPDSSVYATTLYRITSEDGLRNNDLKDYSLTSKDEYLIIADVCENGKADISSDEANVSNDAVRLNELFYVVKYRDRFYDLITSKSVDEIDAGYHEYAKAEISGKVFDDLNYDGYMNTDEETGKEDGFTEELKEAISRHQFKKITVTATGYYYDNNDNKWKQYRPSGEDSEATYTAEILPESEDGYFSITVPTKYFVDGHNYMAGYKMKVDMIPVDYHITKHMANGEDTTQNALLKAGSAEYLLTKTNPNRPYSGELKEELDGYVVVANPSDNTSSPNIIRGYDIADSRNVGNYNIGYTLRQKADIDGIAFIDNNDNGLYDWENEDGSKFDSGKPDEPLQGIEVGIKRYLWDEKTNEWTFAPSTDEPDAEYFATTFTGEDGRYTFAELQTHEPSGSYNDIPLLYGYKVYLLDMPADSEGNEFAATYYQKNDELLDSALIASTNQVIKSKDNNSYEDGELKDGYIIIADKLDKDSSTAEFSDIVDGYDTTHGINRDGYNLGFADYEKGSIEGSVFEDIDYNGLIDETDSLFKDIELGIKRYSYVNGSWILDQEDEDYFKTITTSFNGHYSFKNLPLYNELDGEKYLYGYEVYVINAPEGFALTRYAQNNGENDSSLLLNGQIIKSDSSLYEMLKGKLVLGNKIIDSEQTIVDKKYIVNGYDIVRAVHLEDYNAGYKAEEKGTISGTVFDDKNYDGAFDDEDGVLADVEVSLKRFVLKDGEWLEDEYFEGYSLYTDENGNYTFEELDTYLADEDAKYLYGYEVWVTESPEDYAITRYQNDSYVLLNGQIIKPDKELSEMLDGKIVVAGVAEDTAGVDPIYILEGYNIVLSNSVDEYNAGYIKEQKGSISGVVFDDKNYDGVFDEEENTVEDVEVKLVRFIYIDGKWEEDTFFEASTDENGRYTFDELDTYTADEDGNHLYGYEVWVTDAPEGYAITRYQNDSYVLLNGQIIKPDTELPEMLDGKIVVAEPAEDKSNVDPSFIIENYNIVLAEAIEDYNAGYKAIEKGSISGKVFDDGNYNGSIEENEAMLENVEVTLKRFIYADGEWSEDDFFETTTALTDKNGNYTFDNLDTYVADEDVNYLYGYEVWVTDAPEGYAVTKYVNDSYLLVNGQIIKPDTKLPEMLNGKIVVAEPANDKSNVDSSFIVENYNIVLADDIVDYNAGYKLQEFASISGNVFDDMNYDGIIDDEDNMLPEIQIGLKRFVYENGEWILAQNEEEEFCQTAVTDENGGYIFNNLETYVNEDGVNKLYGYELYVIGIEDRFATKYQMNNGDNDSALVAESKQIIKKDSDLSEMLNGKLVLAKPVSDDEVKNTPYIAANYDIVQSVDLIQYNAGLVPVREYSISGYVWNDTNRDGFINEEEKFMSDVNVTLERLYFLDGKWYELPQEEDIEDNDNSSDESDNGIAALNKDAVENETEKEEISDDTITDEANQNVAVTDKNGYYSFNNLPLYAVVDGNRVVCGYKVKIEELPNDYSVTVLHANELSEDKDTETDEEFEENEESVLFDNDLNDKTGYLEDPADLIVLAETSDETTPEYYNIDNFNISYGESVEHLDAGIVPFGVGSIAGVLFEDANENGIYDEDELIFEGETVYLDYFVAENEEVGGESKEGKFVNFNNMKAVTDENGWFIFDNLPILDENGQPYMYRLDMKKPSERHFTKSFGFVVMGNDKLNVLSQESDEDENAGVTPVITLAVPRTDKNFYDLKWQVDGYNHANAYLGLSAVDGSENVYTGIDDINPWIVTVPVSAFGMLILVLIIAKSKKRKETD